MRGRREREGGREELVLQHHKKCAADNSRAARSLAQSINQSRTSRHARVSITRYEHGRWWVGVGGDGLTVDVEVVDTKMQI